MFLDDASDATQNCQPKGQKNAYKSRVIFARRRRPKKRRYKSRLGFAPCFYALRFIGPESNMDEAAHLVSIAQWNDK
jgi:hypothetical protein